MPNTQNLDPFPLARPEARASRFSGISVEGSYLNSPEGNNEPDYWFCSIQQASYETPKRLKLFPSHLTASHNKNPRIFKGIHKHSAVRHPGAHLQFQHVGRMKQEASLNYRTSVLSETNKPTKAKTERAAKKERQVGRLGRCSGGTTLATKEPKFRSQHPHKSWVQWHTLVIPALRDGDRRFPRAGWPVTQLSLIREV